MKILITGGTGFIGRPLVKELISMQHQVVVLTRNEKKAKDALPTSPLLSVYEWHPFSENSLPQHILKDLGGVINLMGENVGIGKWNEKKKEAIYASRVLGTKNLLTILQENLEESLDFFFQASAIGIYKETEGDVAFDENGPYAKDFLANVCIDLEKEVKSFQKADRKIIGRFGAVIARDGGVLKEVEKVFKLGLGAPIGQSKRWMSWIARKDLLRIIQELIFQENGKGTYNLVSPFPVTNKEFALNLAGVLNKRAFPLAVPSFLIEMIFGEKATLVLKSQKIYPEKYLQQSGVFEKENLLEALTDIYSREN